jgi:hypothetical protein
MQVSRITGNQDTWQMVRGFAPYPQTKCFQTRIYTVSHRFLGFVLLIRVHAVRYVQAISRRVNLCNLWLMTNADSCKFHKRFSDTDLRGFTPGWGCYSIFVEDPLQIGPVFFKTKPICRRRKIQISSVLTRDYEEKARLASKSKQSQTNPISMLRWVSFSGLGELAEGM